MVIMREGSTVGMTVMDVAARRGLERAALVVMRAVAMGVRVVVVVGVGMGVVMRMLMSMSMPVKVGYRRGPVVNPTVVLPEGDPLHRRRHEGLEPGPHQR
jgi:hypothetical protein